MMSTPEQQVRDILERMGYEDAQSLSAGDVVEFANIIAENTRLEQDVAEKTDKVNALWIENQTLLKQLNEAQRQNERRRANEIPPSLLDLVRFMCKVWDKTHDWAINKVGADAFMSYPMIQGIANQMALSKIAAQPHETSNIREAVEWMINTQAAIGGGAMEGGE